MSKKKRNICPQIYPLKKFSQQLAKAKMKKINSAWNCF